MSTYFLIAILIKQLSYAILIKQSLVLHMFSIYLKTLTSEGESI